MKKNNSFLEKLHIGPYLLLFFIPMLLFLLAEMFQMADETAKIQPFMLLALVFAGAWLVWQISVHPEQKIEALITFLLFAGFIMRIGYMLYTNYVYRSHDLGTIDSYGHASYIWSLFANHQLPPDNYSQHYHPPLFHFLATIPMWITSLAFPAAPAEVLLNAAKIVSCFASCAGLLLTLRICQALSLKKGTTALVLGIAALQPNFFQLAGRVNNDSLVIFFQILILLYTIRWYDKPSTGNTVILALAYGLGMMTKLSCATMALFTGPVLIYGWVKSYGTPDFVKIFGRGALFLCICAPLALWFPIRNLILFDQPLNYVPYLGETHDLYVGSYSAYERFFSIPFGQLFKQLYCQPFEDYNVPLYLFRCSLFGEFTLSMADWLAKWLVVANILLIALSMIGAVCTVIKGKSLHPILRFGVPFLWVTQLGSYFAFQIKYPFGCTMDFRYIPITAILGALMLGTAMQILWEKQPAGKEPSKACRIISTGVCLLVLLFGSLSAIAYCTMA